MNKIFGFILIICSTLSFHATAQIGGMLKNKLKDKVTDKATQKATSTVANESQAVTDPAELTYDQRVAKTNFQNSYYEVKRFIDDLKAANNRTMDEWDWYIKQGINPLDESLAQAKKVKLPSDHMIGINEELAFADAEKKVPEMKQQLKVAFDLRNDEAGRFKANAPAEFVERYEKQRAKYINGLTDDKLRIMEDILISKSVYSQPNYGFLDQYFDVGKKEINTPQEFANAKIWAVSGYGYTNTDVLKTDPHWSIYIYHFNGMKLVKETRNRGPGTVAPASEFVYKP